MATERIAETIDHLETIIAPIVEQEGFELYALEYKGGRKGKLLRVYIDVPGRKTYRAPARGNDQEPTELGGVGIGDCARISRALGPVLDVEDAIPSAYELEVSSPGVNRPLSRPNHFGPAIGMRVKVKTRVPVEGENLFLAPLVAADTDGIVVEVGDRHVAIPHRLVSAAHLEVEL